ncbi:hypothetical protein Ciccas_007731 [Cichlidogyrus casuarinus]|uniref:Uncharacterized protein n=1 Tax=Cichlidogyrus casuarinus TaxID=1844966 RepID=A0ABD2Q213_9PLAT
MRRLVKISYGLHRPANVIGYHDDRLVGLTKRLEAIGCEVEYEKIKDILDLVEIEINGVLIHKCSLNDFQFLGDGYLDEKCDEICGIIEKNHTIEV